MLSPTIENNQLSVQVKINNTAGHKLPSSYPSRRVWVYFVVKSNEGEVLFESGALNTGGSIQDVDLDSDSSNRVAEFAETIASTGIDVSRP